MLSCFFVEKQRKKSVTLKRYSFEIIAIVDVVCECITIMCCRDSMEQLGMIDSTFKLLT